MNSFTYTGVWWLKSSDDAVGGVLSFSQEDGLRLKLIGSIDPDVPEAGFFSLGEFKTYPIILGTTTDGKEITLYNNAISNSQFTSPGFTSQELRVGMALLGFHVLEAESSTFPKMSFGFTHLPEWYGRSGFEWTLPTSRQDPTRISLNYTEPEDAIAETQDAKISITTSVRSRLDQFEPQIIQSVRVLIEPKKPLSIHDYIAQYLPPVRSFIGLGTGKPNAITEVDVYYRFEEDKFKSAQVVFEPVYDAIKIDAKRLHASEMLFILQDVTNFSDTLSRWFTFYKDANIICSLFFGNQDNPSKYTTSRFLQIIQVINLYFRYSSSRFGKTRKQSTRNQQTKSVSAVNLKALIGSLDKILMPLIKDVDIFAQKVMASRDYYTNYDEQLQEAAAQGVNLYWLTEILTILLRFLFLRELGFSIPKCKELFDRNRNLQGIISLAHYSDQESV